MPNFSTVFALMRLPCECIVDAHALGMHNTNNVKNDEFVECPWCLTTLTFNEMQAWLAADSPPPLMYSFVRPLFRLGDRFLEVTTKRCGDCHMPFLRTYGSQEELHYQFGLQHVTN
jgi:hypothetical protein